MAREPSESYGVGVHEGPSVYCEETTLASLLSRVHVDVLTTVRQ